MPAPRADGSILSDIRFQEEEFLMFAKKTRHSTMSTATVFWACGAAMFVRAGVYHELGGFDGIFFAHQEEIDLCWRHATGRLSYHGLPGNR